jgi:hypothetical protein
MERKFKFYNKKFKKLADENKHMPGKPPSMSREMWLVANGFGYYVK